jgi:lysophospholipid acyltransferase (LPLAT)-like uncharacterized protein
MKALHIALGWLIGLMTIFWRFSCRIKHHNDTRQPYLKSREPFIIALLHAHMITGILGRSPHTVIMTSRSADGDLIAPAIRCAGMRPVRGSSKKAGQDKGGGAALDEMKRLMKAHAYNPVLTVDGPRGPRNFVHRGVAALALEHGCPVIPVTPLASRYLLLEKSWDQTHIPLPFSTIGMHWGTPIIAQENEDLDSFRTRVGQALRADELQYGPNTAKRVQDTKIKFI